MGSSQSEPEKQEPAAKREPPPSFALPRRDAEIIDQCTTIVMGDGGSFSVDALATFYRLPQPLAACLVSKYGDGTTITSAGVVEAATRATDPATKLAIFFDSYAEEAQLSTAGLEAMLTGSVELAVAVLEELAMASPLERLCGDTPAGAVVGYLSSLLPNGANLRDFEAFAKRLCPAVANSLSLLLVEKSRLTVDAKDPDNAELRFEEEEAEFQQKLMTLLPLIDGTKGSTILTPELMWGFSTLWDGQCPLTRLYSSDSDGYSMRTVLPAIQGYKGPSILIVKDADGRIYGGYVAMEWKDGCGIKSNPFLSDKGCFLFSLTGQLKAYRASGTKRNHMYLETDTKLKGKNPPPRGVGMGGTTERFRFFIDDSFTTVHWRATDDSFEPGEACGTEETGLMKVEVWGCGGKSAEAAKRKHRQRAAEAKAKALRDLNNKMLFGDGGEALRDQLGLGVGADVRDRAGMEREMDRQD